MNIVKLRRANTTDGGLVLAVPAVITRELPVGVTHMTVETVDGAIVYRPVILAKTKGRT